MRSSMRSNSKKYVSITNQYSISSRYSMRSSFQFKQLLTTKLRQDEKSNLIARYDDE